MIDKGTYENFSNQPETKLVALALLVNMAMAAAPDIKYALGSCYISLQQLIPFEAVAVPPKADNTTCQPFIIYIACKDFSNDIRQTAG